MVYPRLNSWGGGLYTSSRSRFFFKPRRVNILCLELVEVKLFEVKLFEEKLFENSSK
jgi:hypothetical protein